MGRTEKIRMENLTWFARFGGWVAGPRSKYVTFLVWILATVALSISAPSINQVENNHAALLPADAPSVQATAKVKSAFPQDSGIPALVVWYRKDGLTTDDLLNIQQVAANLALHPLDGQTSVPPLQQLPPSVLTSLESVDKTTLVLPVLFADATASTTLQADISQIQSRVKRILGSNPFATKSLTASGLHARITGPAGIAADALGLFKNADFALLATTTFLVLILLILLYRSPILAFVPLVCIAIAYGVISPLLGLLAKNGAILADAQGVSIMTVLLFGAGTDYCLFLVARYRERLFITEEKHQAMREAVGESTGAIAMSGLTVVLSLFALLLARYGPDHRFAVPFSLAVLVMALAGITLVPAMLAILGRVSFYPFIPRTASMWDAYAAKRAAKQKRIPTQKSGEPGRISLLVGHLAAYRPWPVAIVSVVVLAILASFTFQLKTTYDLLASFPKDMPSRQGFTLLAEHYSAGTLAPIQVYVDTNTGLQQVQRSIQAQPYVASVREAKSASQNHLWSVVLKVDPDSNTALTEIPLLQQTVTHALAAAGVATPANHLWIAGETAGQLDTEVYTQRDTRIVIPIVIGIIAILLLVYLRSIVAMVYLIATVLLSYFSALGIGWLVLHDIMGDSSIQGAIPLYAFVFLVALGEDYNIFMVSRIWQNRHAQPLRTAISEGVSRTSSVITSAGLILAGTFAVLASLPIQVLVQFGLITAIGVLLDTFVVRPFLVPAITSILGKAAFWPGRPGTVSAEVSGQEAREV